MLNRFIENYFLELPIKLKIYLKQEWTHNEMRNYLWKIIDEWNQIPDADKQVPISSKEQMIWFVVWNIIHIADEEHWNDGITGNEIKNCIDFLEMKQEFPKDYLARRP